MQLLDDSVFYNLLVNNTESISDSNGRRLCGGYNNTQSSDDVEVEQQEQGKQQQKGYECSSHDNLDSLISDSLQFPQHLDSTQIHQDGFQYPLVSFSFQPFQPPQEPLKPTQELQNDSEVASTYQQSVFSESLSGEHGYINDMNSSISSLHTERSPDDFLLKDSLRQVKIETSISPKSIGSSTVEEGLPHKRFHKFYSTTMTPTQRVKKVSSVPTYHRCPFCQRQFMNKSYLSRHLKKHDAVKDYKCPFFAPEHTKCHHLNGEFSRKDTFKAHLKSIHFIYPIGVSKSNRNESGGRCAGCFKEFSSNNEWIAQHIETEQCPGLAKYKDEKK